MKVQILSVWFFIYAASAGATELPIIVVEKNQSPKVAMVQDSDFIQSVHDVVNSVSTQTISVLRDQGNYPAAGQWALRNICVGLGLNFSMGLGPVLTLSAAPRVRVGFSNSTHPKLPD